MEDLINLDLNDLPLKQEASATDLLISLDENRAGFKTPASQFVKNRQTEWKNILLNTLNWVNASTDQNRYCKYRINSVGNLELFLNARSVGSTFIGDGFGQFPPEDREMIFQKFNNVPVVSKINLDRLNNNPQISVSTEAGIYIEGSSTNIILWTIPNWHTHYYYIGGAEKLPITLPTDARFSIACQLTFFSIVP